MSAEPKPARFRDPRTDAAIALVLAVLLSVCWSLTDWAQLRHLNLPDSDDMMRLAQVRDWLAGQGFHDWTQYRLGPAHGAPMHWSRLADLAPAAVILIAEPWLGQHDAELLAILLCPAALFALYLFLSARIARRIGQPDGAGAALVLAAIAYPASLLFLPGRIDHHALQIVLVLAALLALARRPTALSGAAAGAALSLSFGIGLETAPQAAAILAALFGLWTVRGASEGRRVAGFGAALAGGTALLVLLTRPTFWSDAWCDAFTPASSTAALVAGGVFALLAPIGEHVSGWRGRLAVGGFVGAAALGATLLRYPVCLTGPYGPMDPLVHRAFIDNVMETQGLFSGRFPEQRLPSCGLMLVASLVGIWLWRRRPEDRQRLAPLLAVLAISDAVLIFQLRGAYIGSAVVAPLLAQLVLRARGATRWPVPALVGAWAVSAGMLWLTVPLQISHWTSPAPSRLEPDAPSCGGGDSWEQLDRVPAGTVMAAMDSAAYVIGSTHHRSVAAGYHRNNLGNRAMYDFFLASPDAARRIGRRWAVSYVVFCPSDFSEIRIRTRYPHSLGSALARRRPPAWLKPLPLRGTDLQLFRVLR